MEKKKLLNFLKENDEAGFQNFLKSLDIGSVSDNEETQFFRIAPLKWQKAYLYVIYPSPAAERVLMVSGTPEMLEFSQKQWGFFTENVCWALENASNIVCGKVVAALSERPNEAVELAMIKRKNVSLFKLWLEKFKTLSEEAERMLHEHNEFEVLKTAYIEIQLKT